MSADEKKTAKKAKDEMELKYTFCILDGRKEKVGNFRIEPPGLFRGRGEHPKKGSLKVTSVYFWPYAFLLICFQKRVRPEDITINIDKHAPIPVPNMPGKWKSVIHDTTVTWLATWTENVNGNHKYVFLAAGSSLKGQSDMQKFEKARELKASGTISQIEDVNLRVTTATHRQNPSGLSRGPPIQGHGGSSTSDCYVLHRRARSSCR